MTLLHDYLNTRNLQGFQRLLNGNSERGPSTSGSSSTGNLGSSYTSRRNRTGGMNISSSTFTCDVNVRDWLGRTPLHIACTSLESIEYVRALLKNPHIDVNLPDMESLWTPLHRALYAANFPAALQLLQRSDIDTSLKDLEGYTAFDLYNSTVNGTKPDAINVNAELFTWGTNRNAALGLCDGNDRTYPDHVIIRFKDDPAALEKMSLGVRFSPIHVRQIQMSKLHTAVVTAEKEGNLRLCGFGSGGRLGPGQHTQYSLKPLPSLNVAILSVALGQDHTLVLTKSGEVYSWGLNRFSQLGYIVEAYPLSNGRYEEPIQSIPKRVMGPLKKEIACGVAASKNASACWTNEKVFTWGTNTGQLGYDKNAQPVQITPRQVTKFTHAVIDLALSETVLVALLITRHVECIWNDGQYRISFPIHTFPAGIEPYRPPHNKDLQISKVTCCDDTFAALSSNGEVFTFSAPTSALDPTSGKGRRFKPQRVWALRKKFSAVKDAALGLDGSIIICTESGHAFVRTRNAKSLNGKTFKFEKVPFLQRVTQVCANTTGAFGALRVDYSPKPIEMTGNNIAQDLKTVQPYLDFYLSQDIREGGPTKGGEKKPRARSYFVEDPGFDDEIEDAGIDCDIASVLELNRVLKGEQRMRKAAGGNLNYDGVRLPHGADAMIHVQSGAAFPVHRIILASRCHVLESILSGSKQVGDQHSNININIRLLSAKPGPGLGVFKIARLLFSSCRPLSILIFLRYLYSDELIAVWDRRVSIAVEKQLTTADMNPSEVKAELQVLAKLLDLPTLAVALESPGKREPSPSMPRDMQCLFDAVHANGIPRASPFAPDVVLQLADREVFCHSVILRARSPFFASFFDLEDWTARRWGSDEMVRVDMKHLRWHAMQFVLRFMCCGADKEMFYVLDFVHSVEELLHFIFEVLACANELLLDRLILLCSSVILAHVNINNACFVLSECSHYQVQPLIEKLQEYISVNMETFLESRLLDDIPYSLVKQLSKFVRHRQTEKSPFSRGSAFVDEALQKHAQWLALQDIPETIARTMTTKPLRGEILGPKISPPTPVKTAPQKLVMTNSFASTSNSLPKTPRMLRRPPSSDDIFLMDDNEPLPTLDMPSTLPQASPPVWKPHGAPRVDMKAVMAEAAATQSARHPALSKSPRSPVTRIPSVQNEASSSLTPSKASSKTPTTLPLTWRTIPDVNAARGLMPPTPPTFTLLASSNVSKDISPANVVSPSAKPQPQPPSPSRGQLPGLGPVITPSRQPPSKPGSSSIRSPGPSGGKAWNQTPAKPITEPSPPTKGMSFLAIQHSQRAQVVVPKDKRSLREIQEEEHALQAEADFLIWWTAEEERVQQEALALLEFQNNLNKPSQLPPRKPRHPKRKSDKEVRGESATKASARSGQASTPPQRFPAAGEGSGSGHQTAPPGAETPATHSPRKQTQKGRPKSTADN